MPTHSHSDLLLHNFPENGVKFLLHDPANLRDLLQFLGKRQSHLPDPNSFDFAHRTIEPDTHIRSDFSHGVTDLLIRLPFRSGPKPSAGIKVFLLFEHLSAHQRHIVPRCLCYAMDAYRLQEQRWLQSHESLQGLLYEPVIPIAIYTGERTWQAPTPFREPVQEGERFAPFIPTAEPLFLSLPGQTEEELVRDAGALGAVLWVLQQRHAEEEAFHRLLINAAQTVQDRVAKSRHRVAELLSYLTAVVYHFRKPPERETLQDGLVRSIQIREVQREVRTMGQTIADALRAEGRVEGKLEGKLEGEREGELKGKRQTLISQLRQKFGRKITPAIVAAIDRTSDLATLDQWLGMVMKADDLEEFGLPVRKR